MVIMVPLHQSTQNSETAECFMSIIIFCFNLLTVAVNVGRHRSRQTPALPSVTLTSTSAVSFLISLRRSCYLIYRELSLLWRQLRLCELMTSRGSSYQPVCLSVGSVMCHCWTKINFVCVRVTSFAAETKRKMKKMTGSIGSSFVQIKRKENKNGSKDFSVHCIEDQMCLK